MPLHALLESGILVVDMANPPVNCLSLDLRRELHTLLTSTVKDPHIAAVVLRGSGKYFCAGGDLKELGTPSGSAAPRLSADLLPAIERCPKPVIAAIHGGAIGGGFELALACHYRIALDDARIALPEVRHGIIPLSGTVRLPRLWGVARAVPMIMDATVMSASDFAGSAVFDLLEPSDGSPPDIARARLLSVTIAFVRAVVLADAGPAAYLGRLVRNRPFADGDPRRVLSDILAHYAARVLTPAQAAAMDVMDAGIEMSDFDAALAHSQRLYDRLLLSRKPVAAPSI